VNRAFFSSFFVFASSSTKLGPSNIRTFSTQYGPKFVEMICQKNGFVTSCRILEKNLRHVRGNFSRLSPSPPLSHVNLRHFIHTSNFTRRLLLIIEKIMNMRKARFPRRMRGGGY
jgi:hypothetical protein